MVIAGSKELDFPLQWCVGVYALGDSVLEAIDGSGGGNVEEFLKLGDGHFIRVEVGAVGRRETQLRPGDIDGRAHGGGYLGG